MKPVWVCLTLTTRFLPPVISYKYLLDVSAGVWAYSRDYFVGASVTQLIKSKQNLIPKETSYDQVGLQRHLYRTAGYRFKVLPRLDVVPSVLVKFAAPSPVSVDVNGKIIYLQRLFAGVSYRREDAISVMGGIYVSPALDVSYSYDATALRLNNFSPHTHEIVVGIKFNKTGIICP